MLSAASFTPLTEIDAFPRVPFFYKQVILLLVYSEMSLNLFYTLLPFFAYSLF